MLLPLQERNKNQPLAPSGMVSNLISNVRYQKIKANMLIDKDWRGGKGERGRDFYLEIPI